MEAEKTQKIEKRVTGTRALGVGSGVGISLLWDVLPPESWRYLALGVAVLVLLTEAGFLPQLAGLAKRLSSAMRRGGAILVALAMAGSGLGCAGPWKAAGCEYSDGLWRCSGSAVRVVCKGEKPGGVVVVEVDGKALPLEIGGKEVSCGGK